MSTDNAEDARWAEAMARGARVGVEVMRQDSRHGRTFITWVRGGMPRSHRTLAEVEKFLADLQLSPPASGGDARH
jgi:hypothetical protein